MSPSESDSGTQSERQEEPALEDREDQKIGKAGRVPWNWRG